MKRYITKDYKPYRYYHIFNRGNRKELIFRDRKDYETFKCFMFYYKKYYRFKIHGFCLMPNHFHLVIETGKYTLEIPRYMQRFMTTYSMYINHKYHLVGRLFQSPYKAREIDGTSDFFNIKKYLRNNPVEAGLVSESQYYKWLEISDWL